MDHPMNVDVATPNKESLLIMCPIRNKVFIFTKMLEMCRDDTGIATVLGHEMAHSICHHSAEKASSASLVRMITLGFWGFAIFDLGLFSGISSYVLSAYLAYDYLWDKPMSRSQESEADHVGLLLMAASCYDPTASIAFWQRMNQFSGADRAIPEFLSTHPDDRTRIKQLAEWLVHCAYFLFTVSLR
jgi:Zn-dependent protease with chaperone function